jgi:hypothetical protein
MTYRDLTIRVLGEFDNQQYASLAYEIGLRLRECDLAKRAILVTDGKITGLEMDAAYER